ncbi:beta-lactamase-like protein [Phascolomyces articulosus]|uniref:Protein artemis n=1 Tax=Phascolomyces articulosus TaxID=60185 RepID=A0AAD5K6D5_9FUNG|nr:beta-lactamase-like protein [Phascolomyces articulosus]
MDYDGVIREYPTIVIDRFKPRVGVKHFFLTHAHSDHTQGLENTRFSENVYCSEATAKLLMQKRVRGELYFGHLKDRLITRIFFESFILDTREHGKLTITFLPSNHCPGAVMIMIEGKNGTILHTGDTRLEKDYVNNYLTDLQFKKIKHLYLDTTFCTDHHREFITKKQSVLLLCDLIDSFPGNHHFYLDFWMYGYEQAWWHIAQKYSTKIHVSKERYQLYCQLDENTFKYILTTDATATRFHSCKWENSCRQHEGVTISIQAVPIIGNNARSWSADDYKLRSDLPKHTKVHQQMIITFSMHSSLFELVDFVKLVGPKRITPIVAHGRKWETVASMLNLLRSYGACFGLDGYNSTSSSSTSLSTLDLPAEYNQYKKVSLRSSHSFATSTDENIVPQSAPTTDMDRSQYDTYQSNKILELQHHKRVVPGSMPSEAHCSKNNSFQSSLSFSLYQGSFNSSTSSSSYQSHHDISTNDTSETKQEVACSISSEESSFLEILSGPPAASGSLGASSPENEESKPLTKWDRAAISWRASILNRKRPHNATAETLSWDGNSTYEEIIPTEADRIPKRTLAPLNGAKPTATATATASASSCKAKTINNTITNSNTTTSTPTQNKHSTSMKSAGYGTTIEKPICLD